MNFSCTCMGEDWSVEKRPFAWCHVPMVSACGFLAYLTLRSPGLSLKASELTAADLLKMMSSTHSSVQRYHTVLQAVYDASPVVRAEVAVGLARLAVSHSLLFQVSTPEQTLLLGQ